MYKPTQTAYSTEPKAPSTFREIRVVYLDPDNKPSTVYGYMLTRTSFLESIEGTNEVRAEVEKKLQHKTLSFGRPLLSWDFTGYEVDNHSVFNGVIVYLGSPAFG